jgi:hypothetical protein
VIADIKLGARVIITIENKSNVRAIILCAGVNCDNIEEMYLSIPYISGEYIEHDNEIYFHIR